jgi:glycosyltransferase involved in cell wall biosynthesis
MIIPTRNRAKYLNKALESITKQNYPPEKFEVIVVDNGSTDNTKEVIISFQNSIHASWLSEESLLIVIFTQHISKTVIYATLEKGIDFMFRVLNMGLIFGQKSISIQKK